MYHASALKTDGTLWAWGDNEYGQLGDGTTTNKLSPVQIGADMDWGAISAGWLHTAAIKTNGTLWTWGNNSYWQLGDGTSTDRYSPLWAFGRDELRPIYTITATFGSGGMISPSSATVSFGGSRDFNIMPDTGYHIVDVKVDGVSKGATYGYTFYYVNSNHTIEAIFAIDTYNLNVSKIGAGVGTVASAPAGIDCGSDCSGILEWGSTVILTATPSAGSTFAGWFGGGCSGTDSCTITMNSNNTVMAAFSSSFIPTSAVSAGGIHTAAIKADGTLWTWGGNWYGALGDGTTTDRLSPVQVGTDTDWAVITAGGWRTVAIKTNGTLWAWGDNSYGQLGDGTWENKLSPIQVGTDPDWAKVAAGGWHTMALKANGTLWGWGLNWVGELGDGTTIDKLSPVQIGTDSWTAVKAGYSYTSAVKSDGTLWQWGCSMMGILGNCTTTDMVMIGTDADWADVTIGDDHAIATKADGSLWAWGANWYGQIGDGTTIDRQSPVPLQ